jgi:hypothetical protein
MACELVISGWYASDAPRSYRTAGDDVIRGVAFRELWWRSVDTFIKPEQVFIVDSASPVKPGDAAYTSTAFRHLELLKNPGHAQDCPAHYCGYMASVILGLEYALHNDVDMVLYVEQDALMFGDSIVERTKHALRRKDLVFGGGATQIEQSYFGATRKGIRRFLSALHAIGHSDRKIAPEHKFMFAGTRLLPSPVLGLAVHTPIDRLRSAGVRLFSLICSLASGYEVLPFGYGRNRPINFDDEVFYFQHGSAAEISQYRTVAGL